MFGPNGTNREDGQIGFIDPLTELHKQRATLKWEDFKRMEADANRER